MSKAKITTFLMFNGKAEEAMKFYTALFKDSRIVDITRYKENEGGTPGSVMLATFILAGQEYKCIDSSEVHDFKFTPAISLYVDCKSVEEIDYLFTALSVGGKVFMALGHYGFSERFGWCEDRFGLSWQLGYDG